MPTGIGSGIAGQVFAEPHGSGSFACPTGYSLEFDGLTEYGQRSVPGAGSPQLGAGGTGSFTMCVWVKAPVLGNYYIANAQQFPIPTAPNVSGWAFRWLSSGAFSLRSTGSGVVGGNLDCLSLSGYAGNTWHLAALVYDNAANTVVWNINGVQSGTPVSTVTRDIILDSTTFFDLGRTTTGSYFNGNMCHYAVFNQALTASELIELRDNSAGKCYASDFSFSSTLTYYLPMFNPSGVYTDPLTETVGGKDIPLFNMSATNVSIDYPPTL